MKKKVFCLLLSAMCALLLCGCGRTEYLRIHIRAHSNASCDQAVKLCVRDAVVDYLTPYLATKTTLEGAIGAVEEHREDIESVANNVLRQQGYAYRATARVDREYFPTRAYGSLTLQSGVYDALILELGSGEGDNWWCVAYPPLCFGGGGNAEVRSWLWDWITSWGEV